MKNVLIFVSLILLVSCGDDKLKKIETLGSFRVLAIKAFTAGSVSVSELTQTSGLSITASPYITDVTSGGRTVTGTADGCVDPGVAYGAEATCEGNSTRVTTAYSVNTTNAGTLHSQWGPESSSLTIPDTIFVGRSTREKYNGVPYLIVFNFSIDGSTYKAFRRVMITNRTTRNTNPNLISLQLNGGAIGKPNNGDSLSATYSGAETYDSILVDGATETRTEKLVMAWYVSSGNLDLSKVNASESVKYKTDPPASQLLIIGVLRDERGGVDIVQSLL